MVGNRRNYHHVVSYGVYENESYYEKDLCFMGVIRRSSVYAVYSFCLTVWKQE